MVGSSCRAHAWTLGALLALSGSISAPALAVPMYDIQLLGDLGGQLGSVARDINEAGQVVGVASSTNQSLLSLEAFIWDPVNGMQGLGVPQGSDVFPSSAVSIANAINENGQVTGYNEWRTADGQTVNNEAFVWDAANGMQGLGSLNDAFLYSRGQDINDAGQVIGMSKVVDDPTRITISPDGSQTIGYFEHNAFVWDADNGMQDLGLPASANGNGIFTAINNNGDVVADLHRGTVTGGLDANPSVGDHYRRPLHIEDDGRIPLYNSDAMPGFWNLDGTFTPLAADQPDQLGDATDVNNLGQVVGFRPGEEFSGSSFLFDNGEFFEIVDLINGDFFLFWAAAINDLGQITGGAISPTTDFNIVAAVLTPVGLEPPEPPLSVPEPDVAPLLLCGLVSLIVLHRRRVRQSRISPARSAAATANRC